MTNKYISLLNNITSKREQNESHEFSRVLIVDAMNTFIRAVSVSNYHNYTGNPVGGLTGFLQSLGSAIKLINPTKCIIVFDGENGSRSRKYLYPNYKSNRLNNNKISNTKIFNHKEEEDISRYEQMTRLIDYLNLIPVKCVSIDNLEADDVIGYLTQKIYDGYLDSMTYVMSSDQDFMQLINDRINVWSPTKKKFYNMKNVLDEYGIHPYNFILYKTLVGDISDNIPGIDGVGEKNVIKLFEFLKEDKIHNIEKIYEECETTSKKSVLYNRILEMKNMIDIFYKLMDIKNPNISDNDKLEICEASLSKSPPLRRNDLIRMYNEDGITRSSFNVDKFIENLHVLNYY